MSGEDVGTGFPQTAWAHGLTVLGQRSSTRAKTQGCFRIESHYK